MYFIIFLLLLERSLGVQLRCDNDYCNRNGICHYVSDYLVSASSSQCKSGWVKGKDACFKVILNPLPQQSSHYKCENYSSNLAPHLDDSELSVLAPQLHDLMNTIEKVRRIGLWTSHCPSSGCQPISPPFYNSSHLTKDTDIYNAFPLCTMPLSHQTLHQCKCFPGWRGDKCDIAALHADTQDYMACKPLVCPNKTKLHISFAAYGNYPRVEICEELTGFKEQIEENKDVCIAPNSLAVIKYWCEGKQRCDVTKIKEIKSRKSFLLKSHCQAEENTLVLRTSCINESSFQCPVHKNSIFIGKEGASCLHLIQGTLTWHEANDYCKTIGGQLAFSLKQESKGLKPGPVLRLLKSAIPILIWQNLTEMIKDEESWQQAIRREIIRPSICKYQSKNDLCRYEDIQNASSCFHFEPELKYWDEAKRDCEVEFNGKLVSSIPSEMYQQTLDVVRKTNVVRSINVWIGGISEDSRGIDEYLIPCSTVQVDFYKDEMTVRRPDYCSLKTKHKFAVCALPPSLPNEESESTTVNIDKLPIVEMSKTTATIQYYSEYFSSVISNFTEKLSTTKLPMRSFCKERVYTDKRGVSVWHQIEGNIVQTIPCPNNATGLAKWFCNGTTGEFDPEGPNWSECQSLSNLHKQFNDGLINKQPEKKAQVILEEIKDKPLYGSDLVNILQLVDIIEQQQQEILPYTDDEFDSALNFTDLVTDIIDQMLDQQNTLAWLDYKNITERAPISTNLLTSVDTIGYSLASTLAINSSITIRKKEFEMQVVNLDPQLHQNKPIKTQFGSDAIQIPNDVIKSRNETSLKIVFTKFTNLSVVLSTEDKFKQLTLNSHVLGASLGLKKSFKFQDNPVIITIQHMKETPSASGICTFWNIHNKCWDANGCFNHMSNKTHTICHCNHLTNFAVLMDLHDIIQPDTVHSIILSWITIVGCSLSIICLSLTCFVLIILRTLWSLRSTIHCNLSACLVVAQLLLLFGLDKTGNGVMCALIAAVLHFSWLAAFAWVALEGVHIYALLIQVFDANEHKVWLYYLVGYGVPAVIVAISAISKPSGYGTRE